MKVVWDIKYAEDGSIARYKARLVARGFAQVQGIDYRETFALTIRYDALRIFFAMPLRITREYISLILLLHFLLGS